MTRLRILIAALFVASAVVAGIGLYSATAWADTHTTTQEP